jgi:tetratricopeptide (TPR) repeat protein
MGLSISFKRVLLFYNSLMKKSAWLFGTIICLTLSGCKKHFSTFLEEARKDFSDKNYVGTVDNVNVGLLQWKDSDGTEAKAEAFQLLGASYQQLRNTDKAIEAYQQAISLSTQTFLSAYSLGMLYLARSQPRDGLKAFEKALAMKEDDPSALLGLANCLYALRRNKEAYDVYQKIIDVSPGVREALESIAILKNRLRQKKPVLPARSSSPAYRAPTKAKDPSLSIKKPKKR